MLPTSHTKPSLFGPLHISPCSLEPSSGINLVSERGSNKIFKTTIMIPFWRSDQSLRWNFVSLKGITSEQSFRFVHLEFYA